MNIELNIKELVLHGFTPRDRYRIGDAVERELARLFAEQGVPPSLVQSNVIDRLNGGTFEMVAASKADDAGRQVAQAVYRRFQQQVDD